jgi:hypothetical protein
MFWKQPHPPKPAEYQMQKPVYMGENIGKGTQKKKKIVL